MKLRPIAVVVALLALSTAAARGQTERERQERQATEDMKRTLKTAVNTDYAPPPFPAMDDLSFRGFAQEILVSYATSRTSRFDDDLKSPSYRVEPAALAAALPAEARHYGLELRAVLMMSGSLLGGHEVVVVLREKDCTRVTSVTVVQRVIEKRSGCVLEAEVNRALAALRATASRLPASDQSALDTGCILLWEYGPGMTAAAPAVATCDGARQEADYTNVASSLEAVMSKLTMTYSRHYPPWRE